MRIIAILALLYLLFESLYGIWIGGFPAYVKFPQMSYWDSLFASGFGEPYARIFVSILIGQLIYSISKSYLIEKYLTSELTYGTIKSIQYANIRVNNKPLVNIEAEYLGLTCIFKDQPGDIGFEFKKGDLIPIKYQKDKPEVAIIPKDAISISINKLEHH